MSTPIFLSSSAANATGTSDNFEVKQQPNIILAGKEGVARDKVDTSIEYEVALMELKGWNTIPNIDATLYGNTIFTYTNIPAATSYNVTFATGNYSFQQMQTYINQSLVNNGYAANSVLLVPDTALNKLYIQVAVNFTVDLTTSNWYVLGGFDLAQSPILSPGAYGNNRANIQNDQEEYLIHCSATDKSSYNGYGSDVIYSYRPTSRPGSAVTIVVQNPLYFLCARHDFIDKIRITVTDQLQRPITYNGEALAVTLHFRPRVPPLTEGMLTNALKAALAK